MQPESLWAVLKNRYFRPCTFGNMVECSECKEWYHVAFMCLSCTGPKCCVEVLFVDVLFLWIGSVLCFIVIATRIYLYCMKPDIVWHLQIFLNSY